MWKDDLNVQVFQNKNWCSPKSVRCFFLTLTVRGHFHRKDFKWKIYGGKGLISEKTEALYKKLNERAEAATSSYSATGHVYNIFILCLWLTIIRTSDQGVYFMNFFSEIFFNDINHGYRAAILKENSLWLWLLGYLFLLSKDAQNDAHCNYIIPP